MCLFSSVLGLRLLFLLLISGGFVANADKLEWEWVLGVGQQTADQFLLQPNLRQEHGQQLYKHLYILYMWLDSALGDDAGVHNCLCSHMKQLEQQLYSPTTMSGQCPGHPSEICLAAAQAAEKRHVAHMLRNMKLIGPLHEVMDGLRCGSDLQSLLNSLQLNQFPMRRNLMRRLIRESHLRLSRGSQSQRRFLKELASQPVFMDALAAFYCHFQSLYGAATAILEVDVDTRREEGSLHIVRNVHQLISRHLKHYNHVLLIFVRARRWRPNPRMELDTVLIDSTDSDSSDEQDVFPGAMSAITEVNLLADAKQADTPQSTDDCEGYGSTKSDSGSSPLREGRDSWLEFFNSDERDALPFNLARWFAFMI